jgi:tetratricopeptide (TPR) repeat protein
LSETVFRLFVSSPGDVTAERQRVDFVVERLNAEFAGRARFETVRWETSFYSAHETFQKQIPEAADCDLIVAIFRGRLGTPLPPEFPRSVGGEPYPSGTAYEILSAIEKRKAGGPLPDIFVFRHLKDPNPGLDSPDRSEIEAQWGALKSFFLRWFRGAGGQFVAAFQPYQSTDDFAEQIEPCLRQWLAKRGFEARETVWDRGALGSPFPGLAAFEADRARVFFGRDLAIRQAIQRLREAKASFLLIIGASGSGKSSLLRAGLAPRLVQPGAIPEVDLYRTVVVTAGADPFAALAEGLLGAAALGPELSGGRFADKDVLARELAGDPAAASASIGDALDRAAEARRVAEHFETRRPARLLIGVDQAERLFTEAPPERAKAFAELLAALTREGLTTIAMALRSDAYPRFQGVEALLTLREAGATFDLTPPSPAELEEIVARPVAACDPKLEFGHDEPPLLTRLVADARGGDTLPLLQMTLARLYEEEEKRGDGVLRAEDYRGMAEAVTETADAALGRLDVAARAQLQALVAGLVHDVAVDPLTRAATPVVGPLDRRAWIGDSAAREALVRAFVEARLLTAEGDAGREVVRPTHESLLRIWPEAAAIVERISGSIRLRHSLEPIVRDWAAANEAEREDHLELSPPLLAGARQASALFGDDLPAPMRTFITEALRRDAVRRENERAEQERKLRDAHALALANRRAARRALTGLAAALVLAALAGWQWRSAETERAAAQLAERDATTQREAAEKSAEEAKAQRDRAEQKTAEAATQRAAAEKAAADATAQRDRAEKTLSLATMAANSLVFDIAQKFRDVGVPVSMIKDVLDRARGLQEQLLGAGESSPDLLSSEGAALDETSKTLLALGDTTGALADAQKARGVFESLTKQKPDNTVFQRNLAVVDEHVGDVLVARGHLPEALASYQAQLAILDRLTNSDPRNAGWQRDLSMAYIKVGDVYSAQSRLQEALASDQASLAIRDRLAKSTPGNAGWQRDLSVAYNRIGDVEVAQGKLPEALASYQEGLEIAGRLAKSAPGNPDWQRDLSVSYAKVGDVGLAQGHLPEALDSYRAKLAIADRLAKSDPGNAGWQRDLSVANDEVGHAEAAQGDLPGALASHQAALAIAVRLAKSDPRNAGWQHDVAVSYSEIASVYVRQDQTDKARAALDSARAILARLVALSPDNAGWKRDLAAFDRRIAALEP